LHASKRIFIRGIPIACKQYQKEWLFGAS
jgi:hypothetical protein